jgi:hypothetical protein
MINDKNHLLMKEEKYKVFLENLENIKYIIREFSMEKIEMNKMNKKLVFLKSML